MYEMPKIQTELTEEGKAIQKRIEERAESLKSISSYYDEARKEEEEKRKQAEAEEIANAPAKPFTTDEQIQMLTKAVAELTTKLDAKGE